jgi:predicted transcriptional regulator
VSDHQYLFLPIHPQWAIAILNGTKKWEIRTKRPSIEAGDVVVLYATSPLRAVVGSFVAGEVVSGTPRAVWNAVHEDIGSTRATYLERFGALAVVHAIQATRPRRIDPYTPRFRVGQGWRFLNGRANPMHRSVIAQINRSR